MEYNVRHAIYCCVKGIDATSRICYYKTMRKNSKLQFNIIFHPEPEGGFTAIVPSLPGCITYGKDLNKAKQAAVDAIRGYIASVKKHGEKIFTDENSFISSVQLTPSKQKTNA